MNRISLKYQIALVVFLLQIILFGVLFWKTSDMMRISKEKQLEVKTKSTLAWVDEASRAAMIEGEFDDLQSTVSNLTKDPMVVLVRIADRKNRIIVSTNQAEVGTAFPAPGKRNPPLEITRDILHPGGKLGRLSILFSDAPLKKDDAVIRNTAILIAFLGVFLSGCVGLLIGHFLTRRLNVLDRMARQVAAGNYDVSIDIPGRDEVARLGLVLEQMVDSVKGNIASIQESAQRLALATISGGIGIWEWDIRSNVLSWDDRMFELYGVSRESFQGCYEAWESGLHPDDRAAAIELSQAALRGEKEFATVFRIVRPGGEVKFLQADAIVIRDTDGKALRMIGMNRDVTYHKLAETEKEKLQAQLQQAMKMEAVGRLAGGVAHDFNNLLTVITGYSELLLQKIGKESSLFREVEEIQRAGQRAASLTQQLLAFSRRQIIEPRVVRLDLLVADMQALLTRLIGEDISLQAITGKSLGSVKVDPGQFQQILMNLAVNARDAMPGGGKIVIETANVDLDEGYCAVHPYVNPGRFVMLAVSDTGQGMSDEVKERIFEPFFTTKEIGSGTGLGLATTYGAVHQAGGSIEVYSEVGIGTTFKIYLPRVEAQVIKPVNDDRATDLPGGTETVLLVEDEDSVRDLCMQILERLGYKVLQARNGTDAIAVAQGHVEPIDLLLTDVVMPGMGGAELAAQLILHHPEMTVLYTSGYTNDVITRHGILDEGVSFLGKPYTPLALARKVREVLDEA